MVMQRIANSIPARKERNVIYLAGYLESHRSISGEEAKRVIRKSNEGEVIEITIKDPYGHIETERISGVKENVIFVNFDRALPQEDISLKAA